MDGFFEAALLTLECKLRLIIWEPCRGGYRCLADLGIDNEACKDQEVPSKAILRRVASIVWTGEHCYILEATGNVRE